MYNLPPCKFGIGQRVLSSDGYAGVVIAILYTEQPSGRSGRGAGFTYSIQFYSPQVIEDDAREDQLTAINGGDNELGTI